MYVEELEHTREWEQFLQDSPNATFYHSPQWKQVLQHTYTHPLYLGVRNEHGSIVAVCPGFIMNAGRIKIYQSTPRSDYAGPLVTRQYSARACQALFDYLQSVSSDIGVTYAKMCLMEDDSKKLFFDSGFTESNTGVLEINLKTTPPSFLWSQKFTSKLRNKMRAIEKNGFQAEEAATKSDLKEFYRLYRQNMEYIGASPFSYAFLEKAWDLLHPENLRIWLFGKNQIIGGTANFKYKQKVYGAYVGIDRERCRKYPVVPYLIWKEVNKAEEEGCNVVSLGSTPNNPAERHFLQKKEVGGSFRRQTTVWVPFTCTGNFLIISRNKTVNTWKTIRDYLPPLFTRKLENHLGKF
ncbi:MAG: GNAT family N-acetyltransferase [Candidatus Bathyarchaeota archaeon]|nr:GNAT family N-acetyltransferase [Candidatus Bathyarchaeota archaeon]